MNTESMIDRDRFSARKNLRINLGQYNMMKIVRAIYQVKENSYVLEIYKSPK